MSYAVLLASCSDQKGITAAVTEFISSRGGNIVDADQHTDMDSFVFFIRVKWELDGFLVERERIAEEFFDVAKRFSMTWQVYFSDSFSKVAVFVSRQMHCLYDLWFRNISGQLPCCVSLIVSNHEDAAVFAKRWGVDFLCTPVTEATKFEQERIQLAALEERGIELIILARYHQILTSGFVQKYKEKIINIHHSFLPAFAGAGAYAQAFRKGVKLIGATAHYVVSELDQGPIIEQDTARVSHKDSLDDMIRIGQDLERMVLYRAVRWHLERKILSRLNKTVVFD